MKTAAGGNELSAVTPMGSPRHSQLRDGYGQRDGKASEMDTRGRARVGASADLQNWAGSPHDQEISGAYHRDPADAEAGEDDRRVEGDGEEGESVDLD